MSELFQLDQLNRHQSRPVQHERLAGALAGLVAVIWYPFLHLYTYHSAVGHVPRLPGGTFLFVGFLCLIAFVLLLMVANWRLRRPSALFCVVFVLFVAFTLAWTCVFFLFSHGIRGSMDLFVYYTGSLFFYLLFFFAGFYLRPLHWRWIFIVSFVLILINCLAFLNWDRMMIDLRYVIDSEFSGIYLSLSTTAMFTGIFTWAVVEKPFLRLVVLCAILPVLFVTGSRADFGSFLVVLPLAVWLTMRASGRKTVYTVYVVGAFVALIGIISIGPDNLMTSRHAEVFNPQQMTSLLARNELMSWGMERIAASPILGDYGGTLVERGSIGGYIHNLLSVWQAYGLIPFMLYVGLMTGSTLVALRLLLKYGWHLDRQAQLVVVLVLIATLEVLLAKSMGWEHVALVWGMVAGLLQRNIKPAERCFEV